MAKQQVEDAVEAIVQELLKDQDVIELVDVEYVKEHDWYLRVYIDKEGGIDIEDCQALSEKLEEVLDKGNVVPDSYILEVSSPGIDRPLRTEQHFARYAGQQAVVKLAHPIDGRSNFTGTIVSADGGNVVMDVDGQQAVLPIDQMKRAHLKGIVDFSS